ncbi:MAG: ABC transporter permease [Clostridiaceae bacterium]|nr:ABC transporter permease [Clostridiaceae bacterium]
MLRYTIRRFLELIPKLLIITLVIFLGLQALPGDPITRTVPPEMYKNMTEAELEMLRESLGLNRPWYMQYFSWLGRILQGNLGFSQVNGSDVSQMMADRLPATIALAVFALLIANILGLLFGYLAAIHKNSWIDYTNTTFSVIGISVPEFFFGIMFILFFSLNLRWFPTGGRMTAGDGSFWNRLHHMVLPGTCLALPLVATLMRFTRSSMLDVLNKDYVKTARSKGLPRLTVNVKHGLRNAMIPVMTLLVFRLPILVSGAVVIESVFNYTGVGAMALDALSASDIPVVMLTTMVMAAVTLVASCLVDILTAVLDPRIRLD